MGVYLTSESRTYGVLSAENALLLAGLERAAALANIVVVHDLGAATLSLRTEGWGSPHPHLDVVISADRIVVSMDHQPSPATWASIHSLADHLATVVLAAEC